jgi:hypothetical protein
MGRTGVNYKLQYSEQPTSLISKVIRTVIPITNTANSRYKSDTPNSAKRTTSPISAKLSRFSFKKNDERRTVLSSKRTRRRIFHRRNAAALLNLMHSENDLQLNVFAAWASKLPLPRMRWPGSSLRRMKSSAAKLRRTGTKPRARRTSRTKWDLVILFF